MVRQAIPNGSYEGTVAAISMRINPNGVMILVVPGLKKTVTMNPRHSLFDGPLVAGQPVRLVVAGGMKWVEPVEEEADMAA